MTIRVNLSALGLRRVPAHLVPDPTPDFNDSHPSLRWISLVISRNFPIERIGVKTRGGAMAEKVRWDISLPSQAIPRAPEEALSLVMVRGNPPVTIVFRLFRPCAALRSLRLAAHARQGKYSGKNRAAESRAKIIVYSERSSVLATGS